MSIRSSEQKRPRRKSGVRFTDRGTFHVPVSSIVSSPKVKRQASLIELLLAKYPVNRKTA